MEAITIAQSVNQPPNNHLWRRVLRVDASHDLTSSLPRNSVQSLVIPFKRRRDLDQKGTVVLDFVDANIVFTQQRPKHAGKSM